MKKIITQAVVEHRSDASDVEMKDCEITEHSCTIKFNFGYGEYPKDCPSECCDTAMGTFEFTREEAVEIWKLLKNKYPNLQLTCSGECFCG